MKSKRSHNADAVQLQITNQFQILWFLKLNYKRIIEKRDTKQTN